MLTAFFARLDWTREEFDVQVDVPAHAREAGAIEAVAAAG
jgi:BMFP domain-containing protein YqiC